MLARKYELRFVNRERIEDVVTALLRREHAALVRAVRRLELFCHPVSETEYVRLKDVLALLAARKGRKG